MSKFARVSIFSDLNNLRDITLSPQFATLFGYTQNELESYFAQHIQALCFALGIKKVQLLAQIKTWYNGYSWDAKNQVYNPFSILNLFAGQRFSNYWFATGTPTLLIKLIKQTKREVTEFENKTVSEIVFDSYNIENINVFSLLFQTGYLTITHVETQNMLTEYTLNYPNLEVKQAFVTYLFESFTHNGLEEIQPAANSLRRYLQADNLDGFMNLIRALFAKIPYPLHIEQEAYYHSLFYMIAVLMGVEIDLEAHVTHPDSYHGYRNLMTHDASKRLKGRGLQLCSQRFKASTEKKRSFAGCKPVPAIEVPWFLIRCDLFKIRCTTYVGTKVRNMS